MLSSRPALPQSAPPAVPADMVQVSVARASTGWADCSKAAGEAPHLAALQAPPLHASRQQLVPVGKNFLGVRAIQ